MRKIPDKLKREILSDKYYERCCLCGGQDVQWHHNLIFQGRQVNEKFCILPACVQCHHDVNTHKEKFDWIMWNRATEEQINFYSKAENYQQTKERLNNKYGNYRPRS